MRKKIGLVMLAAAMLWCMAATGIHGQEHQKPNELQQRLAEGEKALAAEDFDRAIAEYTEAIRLDAKCVLSLIHI